MNIEQLASQALKLSPQDRAALAEVIWESLDDPYKAMPEASDDEAIRLAMRRDAELASGLVQPLSHAELMKRLSKDED
jgi:putative addiction module component (TIGR02574 family)